MYSIRNRKCPTVNHICWTFVGNTGIGNTGCGVHHQLLTNLVTVRLSGANLIAKYHPKS